MTKSAATLTEAIKLARADGWVMIENSDVLEDWCGEREGIAHLPSVRNGAGHSDSVFHTWKACCETMGYLEVPAIFDIQLLGYARVTRHVRIPKAINGQVAKEYAMTDMRSGNWQIEDVRGVITDVVLTDDHLHGSLEAHIIATHPIDPPAPAKVDPMPALIEELHSLVFSGEARDVSEVWGKIGDVTHRMKKAASNANAG